MLRVCKPWLTAVGLMLMTACSAMNESTVPRDPAPEPPRVSEGDDACGAGRVQGWVRKPFDTGSVGTLRKQSGAEALRVMRPGEAHTLDYRPDRLNVRLDEQGRIAALGCG